MLDTSLASKERLQQEALAVAYQYLQTINWWKAGEYCLQAVRFEGDDEIPIVVVEAVADRYWTRKTHTLNWSHIDGPAPYWLSRINWYSLTGGKVPFPQTPGQPAIVSGRSEYLRQASVAQSAGRLR